MSSTSIHCIRLQGPWEWRQLDAGGWIEVQLPATWQEICGAVRQPIELRRRFHTPTNLSPGDRVFVRVPVSDRSASNVSVNGTMLTESKEGSAVYDSTSALTRYNLLQLQLAPPVEPGLPGGLADPVMLEIHSTEAGVQEGKSGD